MGEFRISYVRITFGLRGGGMKKAGTGVVGWSRLVGVGRCGGGGIHPSQLPHTDEAAGAAPSSTPHKMATMPLGAHRSSQDAFFVKSRANTLGCVCRRNRALLGHPQRCVLRWGCRGAVSGGWCPPDARGDPTPTPRWRECL